MIYKLCAIGSDEFLLPFRLFRFNTYSPPDDESLRSYLEHIIKHEEVGIIYIEDSYCHSIKNILEAYRETPTPIFLPVGEGKEGESYSDQLQKATMQKAIGINII